MKNVLFIFSIGWIALASGGWLGVTVQDLNPQTAARLGIRNQEGVLVTTVQFGSPAKKAGIEQGDVIISLNGEKIPNAEALKREVTDLAPGTAIRVTIIRNRKEKEIQFAIGALPREAA